MVIGTGGNKRYIVTKINSFNTSGKKIMVTSLNNVFGNIGTV
jgi:hypothetical protein